ncbi:hypothetical protein KCU83_g64, partial [Aureobasidium melanogenum]
MTSGRVACHSSALVTIILVILHNSRYWLPALCHETWLRICVGRKVGWLALPSQGYSVESIICLVVQTQSHLIRQSQLKYGILMMPDLSIQVARYIRRICAFGQCFCREYRFCHSREVVGCGRLEEESAERCERRKETRAALPLSLFLAPNRQYRRATPLDSELLQRRPRILLRSGPRNGCPDSRSWSGLKYSTLQISYLSGIIDSFSRARFRPFRSSRIRDEELYHGIHGYLLRISSLAKRIVLEDESSHPESHCCERDVPIRDRDQRFLLTVHNLANLLDGQKTAILGSSSNIRETAEMIRGSITYSVLHILNFLADGVLSRRDDSRNYCKVRRNVFVTNVRGRGSPVLIDLPFVNIERVCTISRMDLSIGHLFVNLLFVDLLLRWANVVESKSFDYIIAVTHAAKITNRISIVRHTQRRNKKWWQDALDRTEWTSSIFPKPSCGSKFISFVLF